MFNREWLKTLKVGDKFYTHGRLSGYYIYTIKKLTKTEIVTEPFNKYSMEGSRFNRETGRRLGASSWDVDYATNLTPEIVVEINRERRLNYISKYSKWSELSNEEINIISNILKNKEKNKNGINKK